MKSSLILRDYQHVASTWMRTANNAHNILADDVGIGKNASTIDTLETPALIVAPTYITRQWYNLCCDVLPTNIIVSLPEGTRAQREAELDRPAHIRIVNIEMIRGYDFGTEYRTLVLDEAHHYRNRNSAQTSSATRLVQQSARAHLLTASPHYKRFDDIWALLRMVDPDAHGSYWDFLRYWCAVNWNSPYTPTIYGLKRSKREEWHEYIAQYMLLRTYKDVGRQLPPLIERTATFTLPTPLQRVYNEVHKKYKLAGSPLESAGAVTVTMRMLTMCADKLRTVVAILEDIPPTQPVIIYTWYKDSANQIYAELAKRDRSILITGDTPPATRAEQLADAKYNGTRFIVATYASLNEGMNLQWIRYVVFAEESYVGEEHRQTIARFRRDRGDDQQDGPQPPVIVYYVRAQRTIDERIPSARERGARSIADVLKGM